MCPASRHASGRYTLFAETCEPGNGRVRVTATLCGRYAAELKDDWRASSVSSAQTSVSAAALAIMPASPPADATRTRELVVVA